MKTKYILVGGYVAKAKDGGKAFCEELTDGFEKPVKILDCIFARPVENWGVTFEKDKVFFRHNLPERKFKLVLANLDEFIEQVKWANVIYIKGGKTEPLLNELREQIGWEKELDNKTVSGSSAGAHAIAKYYYSLDKEGVIKGGLGLLPIKVVVHYRSDYNAPNIDWDNADAVLEDYKKDLEVVKLREGEFKIFKK